MPCSSPKSKSNESRSIEAGIGLESPGPTDDHGFAAVIVERGWLRFVREAAIRARGLPDGPSPVSAELELLLLARELALRSSELKLVRTWDLAKSASALPEVGICCSIDCPAAALLRSSAVIMSSAVDGSFCFSGIDARCDDVDKT